MVSRNRYSTYSDNFILESDTEEDEDEEVWKCVEENSDAILRVRDDLVQSHEEHTCNPTLRMEVDRDYGWLEGYIFKRLEEVESSATEVTTTTTWICEREGCRGEKKGYKVTTVGGGPGAGVSS